MPNLLISFLIGLIVSVQKLLLSTISFLMKWSPNSRILIIGDGYAIGYGDSPLLSIVFSRIPGIGGRLAKRIKSNSRIKGKWSVSTIGKEDSFTKDWLPSTGKYWKSNLPLIKTADIVILVYGAKDMQELNITTNSASQIDGNFHDIVQNIMNTAKELASMNKRVMICTIPMPPTHDLEHNKINQPKKAIYQQCNDLLEKSIEKENNENIIKCALLHTYEYHWRREYYISDLYTCAYEGIPYFSWKGYDKAAEDVSSSVCVNIVKSEFSDNLTTSKKYSN